MAHQSSMAPESAGYTTSFGNQEAFEADNQIAGPITREEFGRHIQLVVTDNQPDAEKTQQGVAGECQWRVNDLGAKHDLLRGSLCWGHMLRHLVAEDLANATLVDLQRRAWHMRPLTFMISQRRGYSFSEMRDTAGRDPWQSSALLKGYQPAPPSGKQRARSRWDVMRRFILAVQAAARCHLTRPAASLPENPRKDGSSPA
jgi:hypothetical protein